MHAAHNIATKQMHGLIPSMNIAVGRSGHRKSTAC